MIQNQFQAKVKVFLFENAREYFNINIGNYH